MAISFWQNKKSRKALIITASILLAIAVLIGACALYLGDYYLADEAAITAFSPMQSVTYRTQENGNLVFSPQSATTGFIFYPGGKVETAAYKPLMAALAEKGILCVLVDMPFRLAVLDINAADGIRSEFPHIQNWYIGGHSLGGSMAASYLAKHTDDFAGLVLLGAYSTADLSQSTLRVLSVYGSEDRVMNREKYEKNKSNLPSSFAELIISGGCHAYFGFYGPQDGDGTPTIAKEEQIAQTAAAIAAFSAQ